MIDPKEDRIQAIQDAQIVPPTEQPKRGNPALCGLCGKRLPVFWSNSPQAERVRRTGLCWKCQKLVWRSVG